MAWKTIQSKIKNVEFNQKQNQKSASNSKISIQKTSELKFFFFGLKNFETIHSEK